MRRHQLKKDAIARVQKQGLFAPCSELRRSRPLQRTYAIGRGAIPVFNAAKVSGYPPQRRSSITPQTYGPTQTPSSRGPALIIDDGGDRASYKPQRDEIRLPDRVTFVGTPTSTARCVLWFLL